MNRPLAAVTTFILLLAGCAGPGPADPVAPTVGVDDPRVDPGMGPSDPTVDDGSAWTIGDWWTWTLKTPSTPEITATTTLVAANASSYQIATTTFQQAAAIYPFHLLPLGTLNAKDLAWSAHGLPVSLVKFPLHDGDTWTTDLWAQTGATVIANASTIEGPDGNEDGFTIDVLYSGNAGPKLLQAAWSPARHQFVRIETMFGGTTPFASVLLAGQGKGNTAPSQRFEAVDLLRWSTSIAPGQAPELTPRNVRVSGAYDQVVYACFLGGGPGYFRATITEPGGTVHACDRTNPASTSLDYGSGSFAAQPGDLTVQETSAGAGGVSLEMFGVSTS